MKTNEILKEQIIETVENQIKSNNPQETKLTFQRLINLGYTELESKQLIGQCVAVELFTVFKYGKPFDEVRYIRNLKSLPKEPKE